MFSRIFKKKDSSKKEPGNELSYDFDEFQSPPKLPKLDKDKIRVLIFKDCERRSNKTLLFDSDAVVNVADAKTDGNNKHGKPQYQLFAETGMPGTPQTYQCVKPSSDVKMLGEMIFGSVAMAYKGSVLKVHLIRTPPQLLMSKLFALRARSAGVNFCDSELSSGSLYSSSQINISSDSLSNSSATASPADHMTRSYSNPVVMMNHCSTSFLSSYMRPQSHLGKSSLSMTSLDNISLPGNITSYNNGSPFCSPSGSLHRRFLRSQMTSLDSCRSWRSKSEHSEELRSTFKQQPRIGIGIIFKLWDNNDDNRAFQKFFFTHYTLLEAHLQALRVKIEKSFYLKQTFMDAAITAVESFQDDILRLYYSPRILEPVWLNLMVASEQKYHYTVEKFLSSFMNIVETCEQKQCNYFLSILLTAVLTNHISWVATVTSTRNDAKRAYLDKHSSKTLDVLAKCHPYNPLWAQLCDLYGSIGSPLHLARTIIVGKNASLVCDLLHLLTYFIRCSDVKENSVRVEKEKDILYRFSGSSWGESVLSPGTPNSVQNWIEKAPFVEANQVSQDNENNDNVFDELSKSKHTLITPRSLVKNFKHPPIDTSVCYCRLLQKLERLGEKNITNYLQHSDNKKIKELLNGSLDGSSPKSCLGCRTLEKPMYDEYCEQCRNQLSLEIDLVCQHCVNRLRGYKTGESSLMLDKKQNCALELNKTNKTLNDTISIPTKSSFVCYCSTHNKQNESALKNDDYSYIGPGYISRERNMSDPVEFINSSFKTGLLHNSTTSHDSGTEMACSESPSTHELESISLRQNNSLSSQDDILNIDARTRAITTDMDSDYCSVDNEQLVTDISLSKVTKSISSTALKELPLILSSSFDDSQDIKELKEDSVSLLDNDLETMNLTEVPLPRTIHRQPRHHSTRLNNTGVEPTTFGRSLLAGYCDGYVPNFVLHGVETLDKEKLATDLQNSVKYSVLDEPVSDAVCVVANTDNWTCELWTLAKRRDSLNQTTCESLDTKPIFASALVSSMIESTKELWDMKMSPNFCLFHLEEQLKDIYNRSKVLSEYACSNEDISMITKEFGYHSNDIELLTAIGATHFNSTVVQ